SLWQKFVGAFSSFVPRRRSTAELPPMPPTRDGLVIDARGLLNEAGQLDREKLGIAARNIRDQLLELRRRSPNGQFPIALKLDQSNLRASLVEAVGEEFSIDLSRAQLVDSQTTFLTLQK